ncbi:Protein CBG05405 [Caenorhabditis briggsae]|uniref:Protein CBG05405 n=1 Tax=Caenorhabditis briggsae TaxID=6238 RepID=A8WZT0_CAEBR|nr:Protein CBG05405 [Caenorhabditis briggsae]CAP25890.1 Protein CBG05405 [Caenorhabditis briggsae]
MPSLVNFLCFAFCIYLVVGQLTVMKPSQCIHCNYGMVSSLTRGPSETYISLKVSHGFKPLIKNNHNYNYYFDFSILIDLGGSIDRSSYDKNVGTCPEGTTGLKTSSVHVLLRSNEKSKNATWGLWISGTKKDECEKENTTEPGPCEGINGFDFEDKTLQQKNGYKWFDGEPNNLDKKQYCIYMMIGGLNIKKGKLDDAGCEVVDGFLKRAVLCGKEAT